MQPLRQGPSVPVREYHITPDCTRLCIDDHVVWVHRQSVKVKLRRGDAIVDGLARITGIDGIQTGEQYVRDGRLYALLRIGYPSELPWEHVMTVVKNARTLRDGKPVPRFPGPYVTY